LWSCRSGSGQKIEATKRGDPPGEPPIGYKLRYQHPIIPPRILARDDEVIEQAHRHVGFWQIVLKNSVCAEVQIF
jgi:hypothetical protein